MKIGLSLAMGVCALALLMGCGAPGAPQFPSLELGRPPLDVAATRKGNRVTVSWTPPTQTTDGQNLRSKYQGPTLVCRALAGLPVSRCASVGQVAPAALWRPAKGEKHPPVPPRQEYVDVLPAEWQRDHPTAFAEYAVEVQNSRQRSAGLSNQVKVALAPTFPAPSGLRAEVTAEGITLSFRVPATPLTAGLSYLVRLHRSTADGKAPVVVLDDAASDSFAPARLRFTDTSFEWEKTYSYSACLVTVVHQNGVAVAQVEGDDSPPVTVFAHNIFPPAVPAGLEAVASGVGQPPFIDLTWIPATAPDLAGYNVFRQQPDGSWKKINAALVPAPAFRDENVVSGHTYTYAVSAVDVHGNESPRSQPASELMP